MTQQQFIEEIRRLTVAERIALLETILRSVREDVEANGKDAVLSSTERGQAKQIADAQARATLSQQLYGIIKFDGDPPTDEEVKDMYADYLAEKYS